MGQQGTAAGTAAQASWWERQNRGRRYFWACVFATAVLGLTEWIWHVGWMKEFYAAQLKEIAKPNVSRNLLIISELLQGITLAYIYPFGYRGGQFWSEGLRYGLLMGFFTGIITSAIYAHVRFKSIAWLFVEFSFILVQGVIVGIVIAYTYGDKAKD